jgi:hypothetical protein
MTRIKDAVQLGRDVGANPQDRWIVTVPYGIAVITSDGRVFAHPLGDAVAPAVQLPAPATAANDVDRFVLNDGNRLFVITRDGRVFVHPLRPGPATTEPAFAERFPEAVEEAHQLTGELVAAKPQDKWVLAAGNRLLVITEDGHVFAHPITADRVLEAVELSGELVGAKPQDRRVLMYGHQRIAVITDDGSVYAHPLRADAVLPAERLEGPPVAAKREVDKVVLAPDPSLQQGLGFLVVTTDGRVFSHAVDERVAVH